MKKRWISLLLTALMVCGMALPASAAGNETAEATEETGTTETTETTEAVDATEAAEALDALGLFTGTVVNGSLVYALDDPLTRHEAVTMLVRLVGREAEAKAGTWDIPFTDVAEWAKPYVGYAYANGLTTGKTADAYGGGELITASQYLTFLLRALGYESGVDFQLDAPWELSNAIGLTDGRYTAETTAFLRGDAVITAYSFLSCERKDIFANIPEETAEQKENFAVMSEYWDRYYLPESSKGLTLSWEQARALVGRDIVTVKKYVKTLEDCLYYLCAAGYSKTSGDIQYREPDSDITWHFNVSPQVAFARNEGNCGGNAGLVAYLLEGDYDEVGMVGMSGRVREGGHVASYLKNGDEYYVFDVNQFAGIYDHSLNFHTSRDLDEAVMDAFGNREISPVNMMIYTYTGCYTGDVPMVLPGDSLKTYIIEGYAEDIHIVYETPEEGYVHEMISVDQSLLDTIKAMRNQL